MNKIIAYIAHPIGGDVEGNLEKIRQIVKELNMAYPHVVPFVPYYADVVSLDDNDPEQRARGIENDHEILCRGLVDEIWLLGDTISKGMRAEVELGIQLGIPIVPMNIYTNRKAQEYRYPIEKTQAFKK